MSAPGFAMITEGQFGKLPAKTQISMCQSAEEAGYVPDPRPNNNVSLRWKIILLAKELYWSEKQEAPNESHNPIQPLGQRPIPSDSRRISAADINAFLRSLPRLNPENQP